MENGWITPDSHPNINDKKFYILGTKGMYTAYFTNSNIIEKFTDEGAKRPDILVSHFIHGVPKGFAYESINDFVDKIISGEEFIVSMDDAVRNSLVILAIFESAKTGLPVKVDYGL